MPRARLPTLCRRGHGSAAAHLQEILAALQEHGITPSVLTVAGASTDRGLDSRTTAAIARLAKAHLAKAHLEGPSR